MIKKSMFEDEIINSMQKQFDFNKEDQLQDINKAIDYLNSAAEIFDDVGLLKQSDEIIRILAKIAGVVDLSEEQSLYDSVLDPTNPNDMLMMEDFARFAGENPVEIARINATLRTRFIRHLKSQGIPAKEIKSYVDHKIEKMLGKHAMSVEDIKLFLSPAYVQMWQWMQRDNVNQPAPTEQVKPGDEFVLRGKGFSPAIDVVPASQELKEDDVIDIKSIASKLRDPRKIPDRHTRGLTPDKMVKNLKHHGHPMFMADDGIDVLNADISEDYPAEIEEDETFEDE